MNSGVRVEASCAEFDRVAQAFRGAMHANDTVVVLDDPVVLSATAGYVCFAIPFLYLLSNVRQLKVDEVADINHSRKNEIMKTITSIRTFAHDVCLQGHSSWQILIYFGIIVHQAQDQKATQWQDTHSDDEDAEGGDCDTAASCARPCTLIFTSCCKEILSGSLEVCAGFCPS
jgi:hypothetical protein